MHDHDFNATPQPLIQKKIVHIFHQHKPKRAHSFHTQPMKSELRGELSINQLRLQTSTDTHTHTRSLTPRANPNTSTDQDCVFHFLFFSVLSLRELTMKDFAGRSSWWKSSVIGPQPAELELGAPHQLLLDPYLLPLLLAHHYYSF